MAESTVAVSVFNLFCDLDYLLMHGPTDSTKPQASLHKASGFSMLVFYLMPVDSIPILDAHRLGVESCLPLHFYLNKASAICNLKTGHGNSMAMNMADGPEHMPNLLRRSS